MAARRGSPSPCLASSCALAQHGPLGHESRHASIGVLAPTIPPQRLGECRLNAWANAFGVGSIAAVNFFGLIVGAGNLDVAGGGGRGMVRSR